ncbi:MAG: cell wall assembly protein [Saprospiraceae bacterium]|nr:MAG: cell wall assembly protein [Saprospiraceae bacterium]
MQNIFNRFKVWLEANCSSLLEDLGEGASEKDFKHLENLIGATLPEDFKAIYRVHNGQVYGEAGLLDSQEWLSLEAIEEEWKNWKGQHDEGAFKDKKPVADPEVKPDWWNPLWIPFTYDGGGNHYCIDLDPTSDGTRGQVITLWEEGEERMVLADSFSAWWDEYVGELEAGEYVYSELYDAIVHKEDL